ncbi:hypothetical protein [Cellulosimicrobium arenosum]|nr:hypothetical protein [Cellulosimicrobium arenosum]
MSRIGRLHASCDLVDTAGRVDAVHNVANPDKLRALPDGAREL